MFSNSWFGHVMEQANPDVLIQTGYVPDGNLLLRTAREQGFKPGAILLVAELPLLVASVCPFEPSHLPA